MSALADEYLFLELSMGAHDEGHVDAYFGSAEIQQKASNANLSLDEIDAAASNLSDQLRAVADGDAARIDGLLQRLVALQTRIDLQRGNTLSFDEESERLFGARAPDHDAAHYQAILDDIDALIGGEGPLSTRVNEFRSRFLVPPDRLADVFEAAMDECRRRTLVYMDLPENESFSIEYVNNKPWSGYNWYQGNAQSLIQINTDLPIYISRRR